MTATVAPIRRTAGKGRQPASVELARDLRDELAAHHAEALDLVDACWPLLSRLELVAQHIGPAALQTVYMLEAKLASYERRHLDPGPDAPAVAA